MRQRKGDHAPQMAYCRNIITLSRIRNPEAISSLHLDSENFCLRDSLSLVFSVKKVAFPPKNREGWLGTAVESAVEPHGKEMN